MHKNISTFFLPNTTGVYSKNFVSTDNEELFKKNLQLMPNDWYFRNKIVTYSLNENNYRTDNFDKIKWDKSIVIFGCSHVFGVGVSDDETITSYIKNITGIDTVNMGISGGSIFHSFFNLTTMLSMNISPLAIVNIWTGIDRFLYFGSDGVKSLGSWSLGRWPDKKEFYKLWIEDPTHSITFSNIIRKNSNFLCKDHKYYECSFFEHTAEIFNIDLLPTFDLGRDLIHKGPVSNKNAAIKIIDNLRL